MPDRLELDRVMNVRKDVTLLTAILPIGEWDILMRHSTALWKQVFSLSSSLSLSVILSLSLHLSISLFLSLCPSLSLSFSLSRALSFYFFIHLFDFFAVDFKGHWHQFQKRCDFQFSLLLDISWKISPTWNKIDFLLIWLKVISLTWEHSDIALDKFIVWRWVRTQ